MSYTVRVGVVCEASGVTDAIETIPVKTFREAQKIVKDFIRKECFENWSFLGGEFKDKNDNLLGFIRENGGFFGSRNVGNEYYEKLPDYLVQLEAPV